MQKVSWRLCRFKWNSILVSQMVRCNLVLKSFIAIYLIFVFFYLDLSSTAGGSLSSKKKMENTDVSPRKNSKTTYDVSRVTSVSKAACKSK